MEDITILKDIFLKPIETEYYWAGIYRKLSTKAKRLCFVGPMPPCHEFEFSKGNVGLTADIGVRKVIADVTEDEQYSQCFIQTASEIVEPIIYEGEVVGVIDIESDKKDFFTEKRVEEIEELSKQIAPVLRSAHIDEELEYNLRVLEWVAKAKSKLPGVADWIGVYFKTGYLLGEESSNLILGPFIGESTSHTIIPIEKGLCGLALREEKVVNVDDVHADSRHIACSIKTNSELIIPLKDTEGNFIAELDIDSNTPAAFSKEIELMMTEFCKSFPLK
jgi:GAF domain-containing protein